MVDSNNTPVINYGGHIDAQEQQNWILCYSDFMPKVIQPIKITPFNALKDPNLRNTLKKNAKAPSSLQQRLMNPKNSKSRLEIGGLNNQISSAIGNVSSMIGCGIRKTNAQILKEKKAQEIRDRQN